MEYILVEEQGAEEMTHAVNKRISEGYTPIGGVSVIYRLAGGRHYYEYCQAMTRPLPLYPSGIQSGPIPTKEN